MNHSEHEHHSHSESVHTTKTVNLVKEYVKFAYVLITIVLIAIVHANKVGFSMMQFFESFMGVFFIVFSLFKLRSLKEFAYGFKSYDVIAKQSIGYGYMYPFIQLGLGLLYITGAATQATDVKVLLISLISGYGVLKTLGSGAKVHCVCLGTVIKLPLSTISFVEDFGMAAMAVFMLMLRA